jgi:hypothetical protein
VHGAGSLRTVNHISRRRAPAGVAAVLSMTVLVGLSAGCASSPAGAAPVADPPVSTAPVSDVRPLVGVRIELTVGDRVATATLADSQAAREFAATLPVTVDVHDRFGQAKTADLPYGLNTGAGARVFDPVPGGLYYWPPDAAIAVVTTDLGPSIPAPGLVLLGRIDGGLDALAGAGDEGRMTISASSA